MNAPPSPETYPLSLHDALPIWIRLECDEAFGQGVDPHRPPLAWEAWNGKRWKHCDFSCHSRLPTRAAAGGEDRKSTRLNSSHVEISYAVFCLKKKKQIKTVITH